MPFTAKLVMLSPGLLFFLINASFILISVLLLCTIRWWVHYQIRQSQNDVIGSIFTKAGTIFGVLIAFVVVILWQEYNKSKDSALKEGIEALELYRNLSLYPNQDQAAKAIKSLVQFGKLVVEDEYPAMANMRTSQATEQVLTKLRNDIHKIN